MIAFYCFFFFHFTNFFFSWIIPVSTFECSFYGILIFLPFFVFPFSFLQLSIALFVSYSVRYIETSFTKNIRFDITIAVHWFEIGVAWNWRNQILLGKKVECDGFWNVFSFSSGNTLVYKDIKIFCWYVTAEKGLLRSPNIPFICVVVVVVQPSLCPTAGKKHEIKMHAFESLWLNSSLFSSLYSSRRSILKTHQIFEHYANRYKFDNPRREEQKKMFRAKSELRIGCYYKRKKCRLPAECWNIKTMK